MASWGERGERCDGFMGRERDALDPFRFIGESEDRCDGFTRERCDGFMEEREERYP